MRTATRDKKLRAALENPLRAFVARLEAEMEKQTC